MSTIDIVITVPKQDQIDIEEYCINQGIDFSRYFLELHHSRKDLEEEVRQIAQHPRPILMGKMEEAEGEETKTHKKGSKK